MGAIGFTARTALLTLVSGAVLAQAPIKFVDVSGPSGIQSYATQYGFGGGICAADFDDDGDIDFFVPTAAGQTHQLYRNAGGSFDEIAVAAGVGSLDGAKVALWFDYDGDHRLDLVTAGDCFESSDSTCPDALTLRLYRQLPDGTFEDVTYAAGLGTDLVDDNVPHRGGMAAGDINGDGFLDLVIGLWDGEKRLFLNNGNGTLTDIRISSGLGGIHWGHHQPMFHDFDGDGLQDIYFAIDFEPNQLWINLGDNRFVDQGPAANIHNDMNDMGMSLGDFDQDGDFDAYVTNITFGAALHNVLLRNDSVGSMLQFAEVAQSSGVDVGYWGWGTTFFDADNDTLLDIAATNGYFDDSWASDPSRLWINQGGAPVTFSDQSASAEFNDTLWGSALLAIDADRDGFLDLLQACNSSGLTPGAIRLLQNQPDLSAAANHHLVVRPRMSGANHRAIGAVVRVAIGSTELIRLITAGTSYLGQEPAEAFFGLGAATTVDRVTVEWPDGTADSVRVDVAADQLLDVPVATDTDGDGTPDVTDLDDDDDGTLDTADCFPTNAQFWSVPGQVTDLALTHDADVTTLTWSWPAESGGSIVPFDVLSSPIPADLELHASCLESYDVADTEATHTGDPAPSRVQYFVVRTRNSCGAGGREGPDCL